MPSLPILCVDNLPSNTVTKLGDRFGIQIKRQASGTKIKGTFWGEPEAGIVGKCVFVRGDTPVHSLLHELCHIVCMSPDRRQALNADAASDDNEEAAVCYLQLALADSVAEIGRTRIMCDMDAWGYSFPEGSTQSWYEAAIDARDWLLEKGLLDAQGLVLNRLRSAN